MDLFFYTRGSRLRRREHIQEKTDRLSIFSNQVNLTISLKKTEAVCVNVPSPTEIRVRGRGIPYTDKFTYLGSVLCQDGGTGVDIRNRLNKARNAYIHTYIHTTLFVLAGYKKKAAYADVDLLKTYLKYLQHLIGLILQIT